MVPTGAWPGGVYGTCHGAAHALPGPNSFPAVHKRLFPWEAVLPSGDLLLSCTALLVYCSWQGP